MQDLLALLPAYGLAAVFLVTLAARIGAPLPAAPVLVAAGALGGSADMPLLGVAAVSILANLAGDSVWFAAGRMWGRRVLQLLCRVSLSPDTCVRQSEDLILGWGGSSLVAAKFVPGVSVVAAPMAGALGMSWLRFTAYGLLSGAAWTAVFLGAGMVFRTRVKELLALFAGGGIFAGIALAGLLLGFVAWRWHRRRAQRHAAQVPRIAAAELQELLHGEHAPVVVDVRSAVRVRLDGRQLPGAHTVALEGISGFARALPRGRAVVLYCDCPDESAAAQAALLMGHAGVRRVQVLAGGLDAWYAAGLSQS
jgi:membrane protein DedA with SNARE-associated domain/rhodanese-related sulfurtransferase